jgi:hypothetical protein
MVAQAVIALAALRLPPSRDLPISPSLARIAGWLTFVSAILFFLLAGMNDAAPVIAVVGYGVLGAVIYAFRGKGAVSPASAETPKQD